MNLPILPIPYHPSMEILDSTKIKTYQQCPRLFFYEYALGWRPSRPSNHLVFGKAVHKAMEHIYLHGYRVEAVMEALEIFNSCYRATFPEETDVLFEPKTPLRFFDMLLEYIKKYPSDPDRFTVYRTEIGGTVDLSPLPHHRIAWKMDTVLWDREIERYCSHEHKTKGGNYLSDSYTYEHFLGIQCGTYTHVLNCLFPPDQVSGVTINCLCFKKTKKPEFILERFPILYSNAQMYNWLELTKLWMDSIHEDFLLLSTHSAKNDLMRCFPTNSNACTNWGRVCQYMDFCTTWNNPIQHQHSLPVDMHVEFWNPLEEELNERLVL